MEPNLENKDLYDKMFVTFKDAYKALVPTLESLADCRAEEDE